MPSTAILAQKSILRVETARAATKAITGITNANPGVVTATAHGYSNGDIVLIEDVVGMKQINGRVFVAANVATNTFELRGIDTTDTDVFGAYASGGNSYELTLTAVGNVLDVNAQRDAANEIDLTNLDSDAKEFTLGLQGSWSMDVTIDIDSANAGQAELTKAESDRVARGITITTPAPSSKVWAGLAYVQGAGFTASPDATLRGTLRLRGTGLPMGWA